MNIFTPEVFALGITLSIIILLIHDNYDEEE